MLAVVQPRDRIIPIQLLKSTKGQRFVVRNTRVTPEHVAEPLALKRYTMKYFRSRSSPAAV